MTDLENRQFRWETFRAIATLGVALAVMCGAIIGLSNWLHPASTTPMFPLAPSSASRPQSPEPHLMEGSMNGRQIENQLERLIDRTVLLAPTLSQLDGCLTRLEDHASKQENPRD